MNALGADDLTALRDTIARFVRERVVPHLVEWDEAGTFPRSLYEEAAAAGILQVGLPEEYGGFGHWAYRAIVFHEFGRAAAGGVWASLATVTIGAPPIALYGSQDLKQRVLPDVLAGRRIIALGVTEPGGGSDVAALRTTARRDGDHYVVNGAKTFITSGIRADWVTTAVRTGGRGQRGVSLLVIPTRTPGFSATPLKKMGWWPSDTATLHFDDCRVPVGNLVGRENEGLKLIFENFNGERLNIGAGALGAAECCLADAVAYARERSTFGRRLIEHQVIRHKLVDMAMNINGCRAVLDVLLDRLVAGESPVAEICMFKNQATLCMEHCAREAVQIFGGAGFMRGVNVERIYREVRVNAIGGGAEEIMRDLAAKQMGW
ncbi:acyl-CoA dehydrogenase family protein [Chelatococcus reniformis]|uniref:Acyl-CoA dehydrogenase n=1 Tax=Chelatococcus reniformis TaxID=1494448 RepID=A0A916UTF1_9HYPH|nr:acyl-CoA dehydrogenase family protein [Chelatococcus reniformis]GGC87375.1 acyl-CoA dehydrogenase [Chelatococcus reniformis]